jgi:hypothetical protein
MMSSKASHQRNVLCHFSEQSSVMFFLIAFIPASQSETSDKQHAKLQTK